jgi:hypothetical protein
MAGRFLGVRFDDANFCPAIHPFDFGKLVEGSVIGQDVDCKSIEAELPFRQRLFYFG